MLFYYNQNGGYMKIYIDLILILNFGFDFILLFSTSYLLKRNTKLYKILLGALFGSLSTLFLFLNINSFSLFILKVLISIIMILITFSFKNIKTFTKNIVHLYLNSIILGGFLYLLNIEFSYKHDGLIFYHNGLSINFIILIIFSPIIIYLYIKQIKNLKINQNNYYKIDLFLKNKYHLNAYLDSGNKAKSIYFNKCINIINKDIIKEKIKYFYEPITTINGTNMIKCFKVKKIVIDNVEIKDVIFGVSNEYLKIDVDVILNCNIWEEKNDTIYKKNNK